MAVDSTPEPATGVSQAYCVERFGSPNVLVNNAGVSPVQSLEGVSEAEYRKVIDIIRSAHSLACEPSCPRCARPEAGRS